MNRFYLLAMLLLAGVAMAIVPQHKSSQVDAGPGSPVAHPFDGREAWLVRCAQQDDGDDTAVLIYQATVDEVRITDGQLRTKGGGRDFAREIEVGQFCVVAHGFQVR